MKEAEFRHIAIIGVGLIGGSIGLAIRKSKANRERFKVIGIGRHIEKLKLAKKLGAIDVFYTDIAKGVEKADIIIIASPVDSIPSLVKIVLNYAKPGCMITDAGSAKSIITREVEKIFRNSGDNRGISFVGSHPLAGSEKTGIRYAKSDLFNKATVVLVPLQNRKYCSRESIETLRKLWASLGAEVIFMSAKDHDKCVSATSHLPHILSASLVGIVSGANSKDSRTVKLLAGSFRDLTRISDSDPLIWASICRQNREELAKSIDEFSGTLKYVKKNLNSVKNLYKFFYRMKNNRWRLLESGQKKKSAVH